MAGPTVFVGRAQIGAELYISPGFPAGTPQEALDTACTVHLTGLGHEPAP
jgi:hypothetical protein